MRIFGQKEYAQKITGIQRGLSISKIRQKLKEGNKLLIEQLKERIFEKGKTRQNTLIAKRYSSKPTYFSKNQFVKKSLFKNVGKKGERTKSTMYLKGGYRQLRRIQGVDVSKVNWKYSGSLLDSLKTSIDFTSVETGGRKQTINAKLKIGFKTKLNALKAEGLEKKYGLPGKVFRPSVSEISNLVNFLR